VVAAIQARREPVTIPVPPHLAGSRSAAARYYDAAAALVDTEGLYESTGLLRRLDFPDERTAAAVPADVRAWLDRNAEAEQLLNRASGFDETPPLADFTRKADGMLRLASLADMRALERLHAGDAEGAAQAVLRGLRIARILQQPLNDLGVRTSYSVIGRALGAIHGIAGAGAAPATVSALRGALSFADRDDLLAQIVLADRAFVLGQYWEPRNEWFAERDAPVVMGRRISPLQLLLMRPYMTRQVLEQLNLLERVLHDVKRPWPQRLVVEYPEVAEEPARTNSRWYFLMLRYSPWATVNAQRARTRVVGRLLAAVRSTDAALAVEQYRAAHAGSVPATLDDLVPGQLKAVPVDPFSGRPLLFKALPDGYAVYSVGSNGVDEDARDAGTQFRRRWGANQHDEDPADIGVKVRLQRAGQ
jgi:hypothetical protein